MTTITKNQVRKLKGTLEFNKFQEGANLYSNNVTLSPSSEKVLDVLYSESVRPSFIGCLGHFRNWLAETPLSEIMNTLSK